MREADYRRTFEQAPSLLLLLEPEAPYLILGASDAYLEATMTRREAIVGRPLFEVFPDNPQDPAAEGMAKLRASLERAGVSRRADAMGTQKYDIRRPDGVFEERYWSPVNAPVLAANGSVSAIVHRVEDVSSLAKMTRAKEAIERALERRSAELERANQDLEAFNYTVAHDLRAPLRAIAGFSEILLREHGASLPPGARVHFEHVLEGVERMRRLIRDLLDLARVSRQELRREPADLAAIARGVAEHLSEDAAGARVRFTAPESLPARADPHLLRDALQNLLGNAWKFSAGAPEPRVELGAREQDGRTVYFVRDNGAGFDPAQAHRLFEPFQRLHSRAEFAGSGIGLSSVRRIVARHGGRVWAEGAPGRGATFYFTLAP